jgi:hypothetical protein
MICQTEELLHKEQKILWALKSLFVRFRGDADWAPAGDMHTDYDEYLIAAACQGTAVAGAEDEAMQWNGQSDQESRRGELQNSASPSGDPSENKDLTDSIAAENQLLADSHSVIVTEPDGEGDGRDDKRGKKPKPNGTTPADRQPEENGTDQPESNEHSAEDAMEVHADPEQGVQTRRMATRSQALVVQPSRSPSPTSVHPFFLAPQTVPPVDYANPDEDPLGPLLSYISKQEEIVRSYTELYQGLVKALRMRNEVYRWCKAEGHVGEMSDGEDWIDLDEWGLQPGELVKGKEEDDNENNVVETTGRRGRRGRAADRERG